jgi:hypothetical protein
LLKLPDNHLLASPPPALTSTPPPLTISSYSSHFAPLLSWELDALSNTKQRTIFWNKSILIRDLDRAEFVLEVQSLKENVLRIEVGDSLIMREVWAERKCGTGYAFEGRALRLLKRDGLVRAKNYSFPTDNISHLACQTSIALL